MQQNRVRWGVLGVARIATRKVIPAMQAGEWCDVVAIASRDRQRSHEAAVELGIPRAYGSYEALIADPSIEAVYIPLPNHLHVEWSVRAAEAGKHVLCEKPVALSAPEAASLLEVRDRTGVLIQEAFMVRTHPQWIRARDLVRSGRIGELRAISGFFAYFNEDPANVRNVADYGGGALFDIGCYLVNTARFLFGREPRRVLGAIERDPRFAVDVLTSIALDFVSGHALGTCSMQLCYYQRVQAFGTKGRIDIEIPFNAPADRPCRLFVDDGTDLYGTGRETIELDACDQYTIQGDAFSRAIRGLTPQPYPLEDSVANMRAIDAVLRSADSGRWEEVLT